MGFGHYIGRSGGDESTVVKTTMSSEKSSTGDSGEERVVIKTTKVIEKASTTGSACLLVYRSVAVILTAL